MARYTSNSLKYLLGTNRVFCGPAYVALIFVAMTVRGMFRFYDESCNGKPKALFLCLAIV